MGSSIVVRVPRTDTKGNDAILLRIEQTNTERLDLQLFATDGESVFVGKTKHGTVERLQNKAFTGDLKQWQTILFATLAQQPKALAEPSTKNVELAATVSGNLDLVVRQNVDGITQRLGEINLKQNDDEEISLFDWTLDSALQVTSLQDQNKKLLAQIAESEDSIESLRKQLKEAESAREQDTKQSMAKFSDLLNAKKRKIRDQQRVLTQAGIAEIDVDDDIKPQVKIESKAAGKKRKVDEATGEVQVKEEALEDDINDLDVSDGSAAARRDTPEPDTDTNEDEAAESPPAEIAEQAPSMRSKGKGKERQSQNGPGSATNSPPRVVPPLRTLPFPRAAKTSSQENHSEEDPKEDQEEETDDEL